MSGPFVLIAVLLILFLVGQIRIGGRAEYGEQGPKVWIRIGGFWRCVFPAAKKEKEAAGKKQKKQGAKKEKPEQSGVQRIGGALEYAQQLLPIVLEAAGQFKTKLLVDCLVLELTVGTSDPADTAIRYGQANAILGAFWYPLTQGLRVKDGKANVKVDFDANEMTIYACASLSLKLGQILRLVIYFGIKALRAFLRVRRMQKQAAGRKAA